jgi:membrane-bound lytic murein transglycosylase A
MEKDASFIFFAEHPLGDPERGSAGTEGVPLTPRASIAVDTRLHALGSPFFLSAATPDGKVMQELMIAQDTGGAIRGPARADIFFGFGREAETLAGGMKATGAFYVLLPNSLTPKPAP